MHKWLFLLTFFLLSHAVKGQVIDTARFWNSVDFMVIPYTTNDQTISEVFENEIAYREIIGELQGRLNQYGFKVKDFITKYEKYQDQSSRMKEEVAMTKQAFLDVASPDVFIEIEITRKTCSDHKHKLSVNMKSFLTASHTLLSQKVFSSNCFRGNLPAVRLFRGALKMHQIFPAFNEELKDRMLRQMKFGQTLEVHLNIDNNNFNLNSEVKLKEGQQMALHESIRQWLYEHELFEHDDAGGGLDSDLSWVLGEVNIPIVDPQKSKPYPLFRFTTELRDFINSLSFVAAYAPEKITLNSKQLQNTLYIILE